MFSFQESLRLPGLDSEEFQALRQKLEQQVPRPALPAHVAPATAKPKLTQNSAATYSSSGSARVDLFFKCEAGELTTSYITSSDDESDDVVASNNLDTILTQAWQEESLDTLKLIAHMRDIRDGKGEKKQFYTCAKWLAKHHPLTLAGNLSRIIDVGYWKDLLELLMRLCGQPNGPVQNTQQLPQQKTKSRKRGREGGIAKGSYEPIYQATQDPAKVEFLKTMRKKEFRKHLRSLKTKAEKEEAKAQRAKQAAQKAQIVQELVKQRKDSNKARRKATVEELYSQDATFRLLHVTVAKLFAQQLQKDMEALKEGRSSDVSLAAKWAPTPARSHDQHSFIATSIAELLFPGKEYQQSGQSYTDYISHIRGLYHKTVLAPLRKCLDVTEVYMSANAWGDVRYPRVPSVCMRLNKGKFQKRDSERFQQYLNDVESGKAKIASGALKPHELVHEAMQLTGGRYGAMYAMYGDSSEEEEELGSASESNEVSSGETDNESMGPPPGLPLTAAQQIHFNMQEADKKRKEEEKQRREEEKKAKEEEDMKQQTMELQWKSYVTNLKKSGTLSSALSICDVSGSMSGQPMEVAIALGLLTAAVTAAPFNNLVCTFSANPVLHEVKGDKLTEKVKDLARMEWGMNTDLNKVFDLILHKAITHNVAPEDMVQTLFIFSDMQFDSATGGQTNFHAAQASFQREGYTLPRIVFWDLQGEGSGATPVTQHEQGAALVSGFSGQMLKLFMGGASELEKFSPFNVMKEAINAEKYAAWKVID